jgi:hypothetical protein
VKRKEELRNCVRGNRLRGVERGAVVADEYVPDRLERKVVGNGVTSSAPAKPALRWWSVTTSTKLVSTGVSLTTRRKFGRREVIPAISLFRGPSDSRHR